MFSFPWEHGKCLGCSPSAPLHELEGGLSCELFSQGIVEKCGDCVPQRLEGNLGPCARVDGAGGQLRLAVGVGAKEDRRSVEARLEEVMAANMIDVAAAHDGKAAVGVASGELPHCVDEKDPSCRLVLAPAGKRDLLVAE